MMGWTRRIALVTVCTLAFAGPVAAGDFRRDLAIVNQAVENNPSGVPQDAIDACKPMRDMAVKLYKMNMHERAERRLKVCMQLLKVGDYR
jgi:hypothetical protein